MHIIKLNATGSTNTYLKEMISGGKVADFTVVITSDQVAGRGQRGSVWESEPYKNLTFSALKKFHALDSANAFWVNVCVSVALWKALSVLGISDLKIKWPNDIMAGESKIAGILIENTLVGSRLSQSIIGIGLNVNQTGFRGSFKATSVKREIGKEVDLDELLHHILNILHHELANECKIDGSVWDAYESVLYRKGVVSLFQDANGAVFKGTIQGVTKMGLLCVENEGGNRATYDLKEIKIV